MKTNNQPEESAPKKGRKVAVIAVHGISDQKPCESARSIADLLLTEVEQSQYTPFKERKVRIPVAPLKPQAEVHIDQIPLSELSYKRKTLEALKKFLPKKVLEFILYLWRSPDERGEYMNKLMKGKPADSGHPTVKPDYLFMRDQVSRYEKQSVYETIRLEGQCGSGDDKTQVDIYEMYWADLSRLGTGFIRISGEFYQLLFHLSSLGRLSVDLARVENQDVESPDSVRNVWAWYSYAQAMASRILSLFFPILNLCLLVAASMSLPAAIPPEYSAWTTCISIGLMVVTIYIRYALARSSKISFLRWWVSPLLTFVIAIFAVQALVVMLGCYRWLAIECVLLLSAAIWFVLVMPYSRHRSGADKFTLLVATPLGLLALGFLFYQPNSSEGIMFASLQMIESIYALLLWGWVAFLVFYFATLILSYFSIRSISQQTNASPQDKAERKDRAEKAARIARLSLALPTLLFSFLTLSLWAALAKLASNVLPKEEFYRPLWLFKQMQLSFSPSKFVNQLTIFSASFLVSVIIAMTLIAIVLVLWALVPSALTENFPPNSKDPENVCAKGLGNWLTHGFELIVYPEIFTISCGIPCLFVLGTLDALSLVWDNPFLESLHLFFGNFSSPLFGAETLLNWIAGILTASATTLIAFGEKLDKLALRFRVVLDALLDVDNYLRLHPLDDNPSARIYARYFSLLRYISKHEKYDAVIIVAHSQGTAITADLLRFLEIEKEFKAVPNSAPELDNLGPIHLFTMGSPLRQLYSFAFPYLYPWMLNYDHGQKQPSDLKPNPHELLNVKTWTNAYRSGDYVGRYLWQADGTSQQWCPGYISENPAKTQREFCLGAGAHTHYWDKTAPKIARELDRLIHSESPAG
jgi:hypothetical protein